MYGWRADEVIGLKGSDILGTEFPEGTSREALTADLFGRGFWQGELVQHTKDGRPIFVEATSIRLTDDAGAVTGAVSVSRDITERKRAEEALRGSEERFRLLFENSQEALFVQEPVTDEDGRVIDVRFVDVNPAGEQFVRKTRAELIGRTSTEALGASPPTSSIDAFARVARTGEPVHYIEYSIRLGRWHETFMYAHQPGQVAVLLLDITERKRAEAALREYAENLQRSNEDLERFAYVSSHDLQEPLRAIVSFSPAPRAPVQGTARRRTRTSTSTFIVEGGIRMQALIQDLLAFSRVNTTKQDLRPTDAEDVMAAVERNLDLQLREAGAAITHDPLPTVMADPLQLEQVVANLVSNAIKFRRPDEPLRIHVGACRLDGFWEFSVADNGIGIEPEYLEKIFVIFQRLHTKDEYPGTGIGLAIVKRIVDRHGGTIRVESTPGEGSTFFFTLPAESFRGGVSRPRTTSGPDGLTGNRPRPPSGNLGRVPSGSGDRRAASNDNHHEPATTR